MFQYSAKGYKINKMNINKYIELIRPILAVIFSSILLLCGPPTANAQQQVALPSDGSFAFESSPQGGLRYQRQLYLIRAGEMAESGILSGTDLNSIGFTIAAAQDTSVISAFKVYLENTTDDDSRIDTAWTSVASATNSLTLQNIVAGDYEWQVQAVCSPNSDFTGPVEFSNADLAGCNQPQNLSTSAVTATSATLQWYASESASFSHYNVRYKSFDDVTWSDSMTTSQSLNIIGLTSLKNYQWTVRMFCGSDSSDLSGNSFNTLNVNNCNSPSNLVVTSVIDTAAQLDWTAASGADRYDVRFRRIGTSFWLSASSFSNSLYLNLGLVPGTSYEWQVRTVCLAGAGTFVSSADTINTVGTDVCYTPTNLLVNNLTDTTVTMNWTPSVGASSYVVRYRLKNSISWTNAINGMTLVHNDSMIVPSTIGAYNVPFSNGTAFIYSGGALYVAFAYANDTNQLSTFNNVLATKVNSEIVDQNGVDSAQLTLCLNGSNNTALPDYLIRSEKRPQTTFGSASFVDSVGIEAVYALGYYALNYADTSPVSALVTNYADETRNYCIIFEVVDRTGGATRHLDTQYVDIEADTSILISFNSWVPGLEESDSLIIRIPPAPSETAVSNNRSAYIQHVGSVKIGYDDGSERVSHAGFGDTSGLILVKYQIRGCGQVDGAEIYLDFSAAGHSVYAVILDESGTILDSSEVFDPTEKEAGNYHTFYFPLAPYIGEGVFYVGLAQTEDDVNPYYPVGVQYETAFVRDSAYYQAAQDGSSLVHAPGTGRLMIRAVISPSSPVPVIEGDLSLCSGATNALSVGSAAQSFANKVIRASSQYGVLSFSANQVLGTPNVYPGDGFETEAWLTSTADGQREYLELGFSHSDSINFIDIYETVNPGAVDTVYVKNPVSGLFEVVYAAPASLQPNASRINHITFPLTLFPVSEIRIALASDSVVGFHAIDAVAIGELTSPGTFSSYLWSPNGEMTNGINVTAGGVYSVTVTDGSGCGSSTSATVVEPQQITPVISVAPGDTATFCQGDSVTLISDQAFGNTWNYNNAMTQSITVTTAGTYTVTYNDGTGCVMSTSAPVTVIVNPLPTPIITGTLGICPGGSTTLDAGQGYTSYRWSTGELTRTITVDQASVYQVNVINANGCEGIALAHTFFSTPPSPTITGNLSFCPGGNTVLDAGNGYASYLWSTGALTQTDSLFTAATVSVFVTDGNGCSGSTSVTTSIFTPPTPNITGELDFCLGETTPLDAGAGYSGYLWSNGETTRVANIGVAGGHSVTVTDGNGCTGIDVVSVTQNTPPTPVISGSFSFCGGSSTTLDAGPGYNTYLWSTGEIAQQITVLDTTTYSVTVTDMNGCVGTASATTTIEGSIPESPGPISGPIGGLCDATNVTFQIDPVPNAAFYVWTVPDSVTILSGQGTTSILVNIGNGFSSGNIVVAASNACGQSPSIDPTFIMITTGPDQLGPVTGSQSGACNQTSVTYSVAPTAGATSYNWTVPTGYTITSGQGSNSITVTLGNVSGDVCVESTNACGTGEASCITVTVGGFSVEAGDCKQVMLGVPDYNCVELIADPTGGVAPYSYTWYDKNGLPAGTTRNITVCPLATDTFTVVTLDANGCEAIDDVGVYVIDEPYCGTNRVEVCHVANNKTRCVKLDQIEGHLNHGDYLGSCDDSYPCASGISTDDTDITVDHVFDFIEAGIEKNTAKEYLLLNPNPASTNVTLRFSAIAGKMVTIDFTDPFEQNVKSLKVMGQDQVELSVDIQNLPPGMYFVSVRSSSHILTKTLIVQNN